MSGGISVGNSVISSVCLDCTVGTIDTTVVVVLIMAVVSAEYVLCQHSSGIYSSNTWIPHPHAVNTASSRGSRIHTVQPQPRHFKYQGNNVSQCSMSFVTGSCGSRDRHTSVGFTSKCLLGGLTPGVSCRYRGRYPPILPSAHFTSSTKRKGGVFCQHLVTALPCWHCRRRR